MDLNVKITLADRLYCLLEDKLPSLGRRVHRQVRKEIAAEVDNDVEVTVSITGETEGAQQQEAEEARQPEVESLHQPAQTAQPQQQEASGPQQASAEPRNYSMEARQIMTRTRKRIEGEDYLTNPQSEGRQKYHTALRDQFTFFATTLGVEKPGKINTPQMLDSFAQMCDDLYIADDGKLETRKAPF